MCGKEWTLIGTKMNLDTDLHIHEKLLKTDHRPKVKCKNYTSRDNTEKIKIILGLMMSNKSMIHERKK